MDRVANCSEKLILLACVGRKESKVRKSSSTFRVLLERKALCKRTVNKYLPMTKAAAFFSNLHTNSVAQNA